MIISASRRTDIPAYYSKWFFERMKKGCVLVRNPFNARQISRISLLPEDVDGIVFWTKDPSPMTARLDELNDRVFYFQFTLNAYGKDAEPGVPSKKDVVIPAFRKLSDKIGSRRVIWRYDPVFFTEKYTMEYHLEHFGRLAGSLAGYTEKCVISFLDLYRKTRRNTGPFDIIMPSPDRKKELACRLSGIAAEAGIKLETCAEETDLSDHGIEHSCCIDKRLLEQLADCRLDVRKDRNQRPACGCAQSIDIGAYDTCGGGCRYCYASRDPETAAGNISWHDPSSPVLSGSLQADDEIKERLVKSFRDPQMGISDIL